MCLDRIDNSLERLAELMKPTDRYPHRVALTI